MELWQVWMRRLEMHILQNILGVFFGTVRRAGWTLGVLAVLYFAARPDHLVALLRSILQGVVIPLLHELVTGLVQAVGPLLGPIILLMLVFFGCRMIFRGLKK